MGASMKHIFTIATIALLLGQTPARADDKNTKTVAIKDPVWGSLSLTLLTDGEPVYHPIKMTVTLKCNDQRKVKNVLRPKDEVLLDAEAICEFREHSYDEKNKVLTIRFTTAEAEAGEARCNSEWTQNFDFKDLCMDWRGY